MKLYVVRSVRQVFFCGGDKDEFDDWKKQLSNLAANGVNKKAEQTLRFELDDGAFAAAYGDTSRPFPIKPGQKVAVRRDQPVRGGNDEGAGAVSNVSPPRRRDVSRSF